MKISGPLVSKIDKDLVAELLAIAVRLANKDTKIWGADSEAPTRLNWVDLPVTSRDLLPQLDSLSAWARSNKLNEVILCGMGGSSLAAEVIAKTYNKPLVVLDSTHPDQIFRWGNIRGPNAEEETNIAINMVMALAVCLLVWNLVLHVTQVKFP